MPIDDDPITALRKQFEMESLSTSPVTGRVLDFVSAVPLPYPLATIVEGTKKFLAADTAEKDRLLLETVANEVVNHTRELEHVQKTVAEHESRLSPETMISLFVDATRKAESTRAEDRVRRVGIILANAIIEKGRANADEIEELMRVATELSDRDVVLLAELVRIEGEIIRKQGRIDRFNAHTAWERGSWGTGVDPELDSVFSKLESYGLVTRLAPPNNQNIMADIQNRYALLPKGLRFVDLIKSRAEK